MVRQLSPVVNQKPFLSNCFMVRKVDLRKFESILLRATVERRILSIV
jgi:hypothetical protein